MFIKQLLFIVLMMFFSCSEEMHVQLEGGKRIVVDGFMNDQEGPYFFKITQTEGAIDYSKMSVTITDNEHVTDHLQLLEMNLIYDDIGWIYLLYPNYHGSYDTLRLVGFDESYYTGMFYTTSIQGKAGNTYTLNIDYDGINITAQETMPDVTDIDSIQVGFLVQGKWESIVPYLFFRDPPDTKDYYLFETCDHPFLKYITATKQWNYSILDDLILPEYVNGFSMHDGKSPKNSVWNKFLSYDDWANGYIIEVSMSSLTKEAYYYYKSLIDQFDNDGGAYFSTPGNAPNNLSSGALGYFRVSATTTIKKQYKEYEPPLVFPQ